MTEDCCTNQPLFIEAQKRGVSHECFHGGPNKACGHCSAAIMAIFDERYGAFDLPTEELRHLINGDMSRPL